MRSNKRLHGLPLPFDGEFVRVELGPDEVIRPSLRDGNDQCYILRQEDSCILWQAFGQPVENAGFLRNPQCATARVAAAVLSRGDPR